MIHTTTQPSFTDDLSDLTPIAPVTAARTAERIVPLMGRVLFALVFILAAPGHFSGAAIDYAAAEGVPMAGVLVPLSGCVALVGGMSVLLGYKAKLGAALLIAFFLVPVTLVMHAFWSVTDPQMHQVQLAMFMKNVAIIGGALLLAYFGAGPLSLDARFARQTLRSNDD
jgi:putative oxidoreductase